MALDSTLVGDVKHNLHPVIGWLRLAEHDGRPLTEGQLRSAAEKLLTAIQLVEAAVDDGQGS